MIEESNVHSVLRRVLMFCEDGLHDVSHPMGLRVWWWNSIKNPSLTFVRLIYALNLDLTRLPVSPPPRQVCLVVFIQSHAIVSVFVLGREYVKLLGQIQNGVLSP